MTENSKPDKATDLIETNPGLTALAMLVIGIIQGRGADTAMMVICAVVTLYILWRTTRPALRFFFIVSAIVGFVLIVYHDSYPRPANDVSNMITGERSVIEAEFLRTDSHKIQRARALLNVRSVDGVEAGGVVQASVDYKSGLMKALPGDQVEIKSARLREIYGLKNVGGWDYERYMYNRGISAKLSVSDKTGITITQPGWTWRRPFEIIKRKAGALLINDRADVTAVMRAMLLGDAGQVSGELRDTFARAGTAHLLAVSGLHVGFIATACYFLLKLVSFWLIYPVRYRWASAGAPVRIAAVGALMAVILFALFTGPRLPAMRATIMIGVYLGAVALGRGKEFYGAFALAMALILIAMPWTLFTAGFQLSFTAVLFISLFLERYWKRAREAERVEDLIEPWWMKLINKVPILASYAAISLFAAIGTTPLVAYHFNTVPLSGILVNIVAVPMASLAVPAGILGLLLNSELIIGVSTLLMEAITDLSYMVERAPFSYFHVPSVHWLALLSYYLAIFLFFVMGKGKRKNVLIICAIAGLIVSSTAGKVASHFDKDLTVRFIDVGQGDSAIVTWPGGAIAIDAGGYYQDFDIGRSIVAPVLWDAQRTRLDAVFATHDNNDHSGGVYGLLGRAGAGKLYDNGRSYRDKRYEQIRIDMTDRGIYHAVSQGDRVDLGEGLYAVILNPPAGEAPYADNENNSSLVVKLIYGSVSILFTGDIDSSVEEWMINSGADLRADVLKVGHHGSNSSSSAEFLEAVDPKYAAISAGHGNWFGHPHPDVLGRLEDAGIETHRTDIDGEIILKTDGVSIEITDYFEKAQ